MAEVTPFLKDQRGWLLIQVAGVASAVALATLIVDRLNFRTPWNFIWMLILPGFAGLLLNHTVKRRVTMALLLMGVSLLAVMVIGQLFGSM